MGYIGVDLGTTNIKAALYDSSFQRISLLSRPVLYDRQGVLVEFDVESVVKDVLEMLKELGNLGVHVKQIAMSGQAESLILLSETGIPLRRAISWMDERSGAECAKLAVRFTPEVCHSITGQSAIIPTWPATKILHISRNEKNIWEKTAKYTMLKDYVAYRLSDTLAADKSIATFSLYFDIHKGRYWADMMEACAIREDQLPELVEPCSVIGKLSPAHRLGSAFCDTRVNTGTLDHFAGMIGAGNIEPGGISESTGTVLAITALLSDLPAESEKVALHYGPFPGTKAVISVVESGGVCLDWFKNNFLPDVTFEQMNNLIQAKGQNELIFLPYLVGVNAPEFETDARGIFYGMRADTDKIALAGAVMEGVAILLQRNLDAMRRAGIPVSHIISTGGGAKSDVWSQMKADFCGLEVRVPADSETACLGAAMIAAVSCGDFKDYKTAAETAVRIRKRFFPRESATIQAKKAGFDILYRAMIETTRVISERQIL